MKIKYYLLIIIILVSFKSNCSEKIQLSINNELYDSIINNNNNKIIQLIKKGRDVNYCRKSSDIRYTSA